MKYYEPRTPLGYGSIYTIFSQGNDVSIKISFRND